MTRDCKLLLFPIFLFGNEDGKKEVVRGRGPFPDALECILN